jgi:lathosterol oxidase
MTEYLIYLIKEAPLFYSILFFAALNLIMYSAGTFLGERIGRQSARRISAEMSPFGPKEFALGMLSTLINISVTVVGLLLYRGDVLTLPEEVGVARLLFDIFLFLLTMDALMYALHRVAHVRLLYSIHSLHHQYDKPSAGSLFVLHPVETLGFGSLWIVLLFIYPFSFWAVVVYVGLNLYYGLVGHLGVELYPSWWAKHPFFGWFTTCTFHDQHHRDPRYNHGFYTTFWDRLFGTLHPSYQTEFFSNAGSAPGLTGNAAHSHINEGGTQ